MLDNALLVTIIFIIITTIVSAIISSRRRDRCLTSFSGFMVTLLEKDGKRVWGNLAVEASGLELLYSEDYRDEDHIETSYILFKEEYDRLYLLLRFHSELSEANKRKRIQEVKKAYHPWPPRLLARKARNIANTCKDSIFEIMGLAGLFWRLQRLMKRYKNMSESSRSIAGSFSKLWMSPTQMAIRQSSVTSLCPDPMHLFAMELKFHMRIRRHEPR